MYHTNASKCTSQGLFQLGIHHAGAVLCSIKISTKKIIRLIIRQALYENTNNGRRYHRPRLSHGPRGNKMRFYYLTTGVRASRMGYSSSGPQPTGLKTRAAEVGYEIDLKSAQPTNLSLYQSAFFSIFVLFVSQQLTTLSTFHTNHTIFNSS